MTKEEEITRDFEAVKQKGWALRYVRNQTPELCIEAVKQEGWALEFVENQTPEICLAAVKQNGWTLKYVKNRTPEICLAAVEQNGLALEYVKNQTPEICLAAVKQNDNAIYYVRDVSMLEVNKVTKEKTPHPNADMILQVALWLAGGETEFEYFEDCPFDGPLWHCTFIPMDCALDNREVRLRPDATSNLKTITVNGFEVPEPIRVLPESGKVVYAAVSEDCGRLGIAGRVALTGDDVNVDFLSLLRLGLLHTTKEAARAHWEAMIAPSKLKTGEDE